MTRPNPDYWSTIRLADLDVPSNSGSGLEKTSCDDFVIAYAREDTWTNMPVSWSSDAIPGDWVIRYRPVTVNTSEKSRLGRCEPEGIVVSVVYPQQLEDNDSRRRFLVMWFR